jgi:Zn-finger nucleic acid-binding protein/uncharacterized protein YxjI
MQFECPVCQNALRKTTYEGTNIYPCGQGCGTFLGRRNLRLIEESREESILMSAVPKAGDDRGSIKACPKCRGEMSKRNYGELNTTVIDYCGSCQGIWLDPGELERIQVFYEAANDFSEEVVKSRQAAALFACPECRTEQLKNEICIQCGLVFAKRESRAQVERGRRFAGSAKTSQLESVFDNLLSVQVDQQYHLTEALLAFERKNAYQLTLFPADQRRGQWRIDEENLSALSILGRNIFGLLYAFTMHVKDGMGNVVLRLHRKPRLYFHELEVYDEAGVQFGLVKRVFSFLHRVVVVNNAKGRRQLRVVGPIWSPWTFHVYDGGKKVAVMSKKWSGLLKEAYTDADKFNIEFTEPLASSKKRLSLAALMLIDSLYFEGKKSFFNHFMAAPGIQLILLGAIIMWVWVKL